mmetsp:Transcript_61711/g.69105  ORF Transcript_61711/g.69105 Transcript_61711/m.69105 type:complete len:175 (+) Transcript_61711:473-997(+)
MKSGLSLFSNDGHLLIRYEQFHFVDRDNLVEELVYIMYQWKIDVDTTMLLLDDDTKDNDEDESIENTSSSSSSSSPYRITYITIEGGDTLLLDILWSNAANAYYNHSNNNGSNNHHNRDRPNIVRISPEEWRAELLTKKEATNKWRTKCEGGITIDYTSNCLQLRFELNSASRG